MLYNYSVVPLFEDHFDERVETIVNDVRTGAVTTPLFYMSLVPEGEPVVDKLAPLERAYIRYRDALLSFAAAWRQTDAPTTKEAQERKNTSSNVSE